MRNLPYIVQTKGYNIRMIVKDTSTIMRNLPYIVRTKGYIRMIVLVSLMVLLRGFPCFHDFSHDASLHPYYSFN